MAKKAGRPTRDPTGTASRLLPVRLTETERATYQKAASQSGISLSEWIRQRLNKAAGRELPSGK